MRTDFRNDFQPRLSAIEVQIALLHLQPYRFPPDRNKVDPFCDASLRGGAVSIPDAKKLLERIHTRLDESLVGISQVVADLAAADLAILINELTLVEAATVEKLEPPRAAEILSGLSADERTDVIQKMGHHPRHLIVPRIPVEERKELEGLLQYPAHTAGGIMTTEFVQLDPK